MLVGCWLDAHEGSKVVKVVRIEQPELDGDGRVTLWTGLARSRLDAGLLGGGGRGKRSGAVRALFLRTC